MSDTADLNTQARFDAYPLRREYYDYKIREVYQNVTPEIIAAVSEFWVRNKILPAGVDPSQRAKQLALIAVNQDGQIGGVTTVYPGMLDQYGLQKFAGDPFFLFRTFIQPGGRVPQMPEILTLITFDVLNEHYSDHKAKGMAVILENKKLTRPGMRKRFDRGGFTLEGQTRQGLDVYCRFFDQALN